MSKYLLEVNIKERHAEPLDVTILLFIDAFEQVFADWIYIIDRKPMQSKKKNKVVGVSLTLNL